MSDAVSGSGAVQRERDLERFLTFVDAIVAIAITLLVLPLVEAAGQVGTGESVSQLLHTNAAQIGAFFLSFAVISNLWLAQHAVLRHVVAADARMNRLLLLWTLTIVVLPFPTALISGHDVSDQAATKILYVGTMAASALVLTMVTFAVRRDRGLRDSDEAPDYWGSLLVTGAFLVALALMLLFPALSYWPLLLLLVRRVPLRGRSG
jgi:uncharacterized membrane protein